MDALPADSPIKRIGNRLRTILKDKDDREAFMSTIPEVLETEGEDAAIDMAANAAFSRGNSQDKKAVARHEMAGKLIALSEQFKRLSDVGIESSRMKSFMTKVLAQPAGMSIPFNTILQFADVEDTEENQLLVEIFVQVAREIQEYRQIMTGAAFSEQETAEYASLFPQVGNKPAVNKAILQGGIIALRKNQELYFKSVFGEQNAKTIMDSRWDDLTLEQLADISMTSGLKLSDLNKVQYAELIESLDLTKSENQIAKDIRKQLPGTTNDRALSIASGLKRLGSSAKEYAAYIKEAVNMYERDNLSAEDIRRIWIRTGELTPESIDIILDAVFDEE